MLSIIKQYKNLIRFALKNSLDGGESPTIEQVNEELKIDLIKYVRSLDKKTRILFGDGKIDSKDKISDKDLGILKKIYILDGGNLDTTTTTTIDKKIKEIIEKIETITNNTSKNLEELKTELYKDRVVSGEQRTNNTYSEETTKEKVTETQSSLLGVDELRSETDIRKVTNFESLRKLLSKGQTELSELNLSKLGTSIKKGNIESFSNILGFANYTKIKTAIINAGYEEKNNILTDDKEFASIYFAIMDVIETQKTISSSSSSSNKIKMLLDFNRDGKLHPEANFNVGELQMNYFIFNALSVKKGKEEEGFKNLLTNIGLKPDSWEKDMNTNYFAFREKFKDALATVIEMGLNPATLVEKDGMKKAIELKYKETKKLETDIENGLKSKLQILGDRVAEGDKKRILDFIKLQSISIILGAKKGIGAKFDTKKIVDSLLEAIGIGKFDGKTGFYLGGGIFKDKLKEKGITLDAGIASELKNFFIPVLTIEASIEINSYDKLPTFMSNKSANVVILNLTGALGADLSIGAGIGIKIDNEKTKAGIEKMKNSMKNVLDKMAVDIKLNKDDNYNNIKLLLKENFTKTPSPLEIQTTLDLYNKMLNVYNNVNGNIKGTEDMFLNDMIAGVLANYSNNLYMNANGINLNSIGLGIGFIKNYNPMLVFYVGGELIKSQWKEIAFEKDEARKITYKNITLEKVGGKIENGILTITETNRKFQVSVGDGSNAKITRTDSSIKIEGENNIKIDEDVSNKGTLLTIVVGGGEKDKNGQYINNENDYTNGNINGTEKFGYTFKSVEQSDYDSISSIRKVIYNTFNQDALTHKTDTPGLQKLQVEIFNFLKGTEPNKALDTMWNSFIKTLYKFKGKYENFIYINDINTIIDNNERILVLQSFLQSLSKKKGLEFGENNKVTVKGSKTLNEYDKTRGNFFEDVFKKGGLELIVTSQKNSWSNDFGNLKSYTLKSSSKISEINGGIAFSANIAGKERTKGLIPILGVFDVVSKEDNNGIYEVNNNNNVIDLIPKATLESIKSQFENNGFEIPNGDTIEKVLKSPSIYGISYKTYFAKMGECVNDAIIIGPINFTPNTIGLSATGSSSVLKTDVIKWSLGYSYQEKEKPIEKPEIITKPGAEATPVVTTTPGAIENPSTTTTPSANPSPPTTNNGSNTQGGTIGGF